MRYFSAISSLIVLNILTVLFLLYLGNVSREIEKQNYTLEKKINFINDQIAIGSLKTEVSKFDKRVKVIRPSVDLIAEFKMWIDISYE